MQSDSPVRLLCTADLHLGRYPSRIPIGKHELSVEFVWERIIDYAVTEQVDALVLAGDVVDEDNKFFESFGALERGLKRLEDAGIHTFAVSGNHDFDVLPRLNQVLCPDRFHLIGEDGTWETATLTRDGKPAIEFLGWSFPSRRVRTSPLHDVPEPRGDVPVIGLVHGDLNAEASPYAPLAESDLKRVPVAAWVLGHLHRASKIDHRSGCILYAGSPQPLDPGETGDHGPYVLEVHPNGRVDARQVQLATLKYAACDVNLSDVASADDFESVVLTVIRDRLQSEIEENVRLKHVVYRPHYVGRTTIERDIDKLHAQVRIKLDVPVGDAFATIDTFTIATRPAVDLAELLKAGGPLSELAGLLLRLERGDDDEVLRPLLRDVVISLESISRASAYSPLREHGYADDPDMSDVKKMLARQGMLLLDELVSQTRRGVSG